MLSEAYMIIIESERITENVPNWPTDVISMMIRALCGKANIYSYRPVDLRIYIKNYAAMVNLLGDNSQIAQLECLRAGIG